jgi:hypothetical protein
MLIKATYVSALLPGLLIWISIKRLLVLKLKPDRCEECMVEDRRIEGVMRVPRLPPSVLISGDWVW